MADKVLEPMSRPFMRLHPNTITLLAIISALIAGILFTRPGYEYLLLAFLFVLLNSLFDAMDGKVARKKGIASPFGDFMDHVLDRYADIFMLGGIAFGPYCSTELGIFAITGVLLGSYMGTQAQAVGAGRNYGGILGRADRLVLLLIVTLAQTILVLKGNNFVFGWGRWAFTPLGWLMVWFAVAGNITAIQRGYGTWKWFVEHGDQRKK